MFLLGIFCVLFVLGPKMKDKRGGGSGNPQQKRKYILYYTYLESNFLHKINYPQFFYKRKQK